MFILRTLTDMIHRDQVLLYVMKGGLSHFTLHNTDLCPSRGMLLEFCAGLLRVGAHIAEERWPG